MTYLVLAFVAALLVSCFLCYVLGKSSHDAPAGAAPEDKQEVNPAGNWLVGTGGEVAGRVFHIGRRPVTIGRDVGSFVQLREAGASRRHLQLTPVPEGVMAVDMESRNGTFVNGQRITNALAEDGAEIEIGEATFKYYQDAVFDVDDDEGLGTKQADTVAAMVTLGLQGQGFKQMIRDAVSEAGGDVAAAANRLGVDPALLEEFLD